MILSGTGAVWPHEELRTLAIDIGGSGLKTSVRSSGSDDRRASVGFPGLVRRGRVIEDPSLSRAQNAGDLDPELALAWSELELNCSTRSSFSHIPNSRTSRFAEVRPPTSAIRGISFALRRDSRRSANLGSLYRG